MIKHKPFLTYAELIERCLDEDTRFGHEAVFVKPSVVLTDDTFNRLRVGMPNSPRRHNDIAEARKAYFHIKHWIVIIRHGDADDRYKPALGKFFISHNRKLIKLSDKWNNPHILFEIMATSRNNIADIANMIVSLQNARDAVELSKCQGLVNSYARPAPPELPTTLIQ